MIKITKYNLETGYITGSAFCQVDLVQHQVSTGEGFIVGDYNNQEYMVVDGQAVPKQDDGTEELRDYEQAVSIRNSMLLECDWTQLPDAPVNHAEWATYRQELRDITTQVGFPNNVVWPTKPE